MKVLPFDSCPLPNPIMKYVIMIDGKKPISMGAVG